MFIKVISWLTIAKTNNQVLMFNVFRSVPSLIFEAKIIHDYNTNVGYSVPQARSGVSGVHAKSTRLTATV